MNAGNQRSQPILLPTPRSLFFRWVYWGLEEWNSMLRSKIQICLTPTSIFNVPLQTAHHRNKIFKLGYIIMSLKQMKISIPYIDFFFFLSLIGPLNHIKLSSSSQDNRPLLVRGQTLSTCLYSPRQLSVLRTIIIFKFEEKECNYFLKNKRGACWLESEGRGKRHGEDLHGSLISHSLQGIQMIDGIGNSTFQTKVNTRQLESKIIESNKQREWEVSKLKISETEKEGLFR